MPIRIPLAVRGHRAAPREGGCPTPSPGGWHSRGGQAVGTLPCHCHKLSFNKHPRSYFPRDARITLSTLTPDVTESPWMVSWPGFRMSSRIPLVFHFDNPFNKGIELELTSFFPLWTSCGSSQWNLLGIYRPFKTIQGICSGLKSSSRTFVKNILPASLSLWKPAYLPTLPIHLLHFPDLLKGRPRNSTSLPTKPSWQWAIYKPEVKTLQSCQVLCINSFTGLGSCYLEATFIFTLFSLRIILLDREDRGKKDTEHSAFWMSLASNYRPTCNRISFSLNVSKVPLIFPGIILTVSYQSYLIFFCPTIH